MAHWKHATQRGGYISLAHRRRTPVRWDGVFEAPADAVLEGKLQAAGHKRLEGKPGPDAGRPPSWQSETQRRIETRRTARARGTLGELAKKARLDRGTPAGASTSPKPDDAGLKLPLRGKDEAHKALVNLAKKNGVATGGTFEELTTRLQAAGFLEKA